MGPAFRLRVILILIISVTVTDGCSVIASHDIDGVTTPGTSAVAAHIYASSRPLQTTPTVGQHLVSRCGAAISKM